MRRALLALLVTLAAAPSFAQMTHESEPASGLVRFKPLIGSWKGTDPGGNPLTLSYKMVSEDKALLETLGQKSRGRHSRLSA